MCKLKNGYIISELDKNYNFTYDGELLQLLPQNSEDIKPFDFLVNRVIDKELIEGLTTAGEKIFFLNCRLKRNLSSYVAKPAGYVCFNNKEKCFRTLTVYGEVINYFYRPNQIFCDEKSEYSYDNKGGAVLVLRSFKDITKTFDIVIKQRKSKATVSITLPPKPEDMQSEYSLGKPKSFFRIEFEENVPVEDFSSIYLWLICFFEFLNFQKEIYFERIELGTYNYEKMIEKKADVHLIHKRNMELGNVGRTIGYYFVEGKINDLMNILNDNNLNMLFIPENKNENKYIDHQKYMTCCISFESVFNFVFPNAKANDNTKFYIAKKEITDFINEQDERYKGENKKIREAYSSLKRVIEYADYSLSEKYKYCEKHYDHFIKDYKENVYRGLKINKEQQKTISQSFAKLRNILMHSALGEIEPVHMAAYLMARCYIYVMLLDKVGVDEGKIVQCIDAIL